MTIAIINYFIESSILFTLLFITYLLSFARYKNFHFNRLYLLFTVAFALTIPLLNLQLLPSVYTGNLNIQQVIQLPEITVTSGTSEMVDGGALGIGYLETLLLIYSTGFIFLLLRFIYRFSKISSFIRRNYPYSSYQKFYFLIPTNGKIQTCSFFNFLLWDNSQNYTEDERELILQHEETHIKHKHSYDIVLTEVLIVFFWFNPAIYFYRYALVALHEFVADEKAALLTDKTHYIALLSFETLKSLKLTLGNNFHQTQIFKRMNMLKSEKKRTWWSRIALTIPLFAILFYVFACEKETIENQSATAGQQISSGTELPEGMSLVNVNDVSSEMKEWYNNYLSDSNTEGKILLVSIDTNATDIPTKGSDFEIKSVNVLKEEGLIYAIVKQTEGHVAENDIAIRKTSDEVFTVVQEQPVPSGGMVSFYQHIMHNIKYPAQAREQKIEGKVFVEFIVNKDGTLSDVKVAKGIGGGCDEEAIRVVENSPEWTPGKQRGTPVRVRMILPINFALGEVDKAVNTNKEFNQSPDQINEVVVVGH